MAYRLTCPCGQHLYGRTQDELVDSATSHLEARHQRSYTADEIMFMAMRFPDEQLPAAQRPSDDQAAP